ncbi:MAG: ATP-binding protein [Candidatus Margulisbacteria bacterium]|nr:ATP-binding protein [Candidatus Margulisiibacteriota bacterium]
MSYIVAAVLNIFFSLTILNKSKDFPLNILVAFIAIFSAIWCMTWFFFFTLRDILWLQLTYVAGFIPPIYVAMSLLLLNKNKKQALWTLFLLALPQLILIVLPWNLLVKDIISYNPVIFNPGSVLVPLYRLYWGVLIWAGIIINFEIIRRSKEDRKKVVYIIIGSLIFAIFSMIATVIFPVILKDSTLTKYPPLVSTIWVAFLTYAIIRHKFMDTELIIKRGTYFLMLFLLIISPYFILINFLTDKFQHFFGTYKFIIGAFLWTIFILFSDFIKKILIKTTDKIFYKADYNYSEVLAEMNKKMQEITDIKVLIKRFHEDIERILKTESFGIFMLNKPKTSFIYLTANNMDIVLHKKIDRIYVKNIVHIKPDHYIIQSLIKGYKNTLSYDDLKEESAEKKTEETRESIELMENIHSKLLVASVYDNNVSGIISVGEKKSGDKFNEKDINLLSNIVHQGALVMSKIFEIEDKMLIKAEKEVNEHHRKELEDKNILLERALHELKSIQEKLIEEEQMSAMGQLAGEVAHDMRNPLSSMNRLIVYLLEQGHIDNNEKVLVEVFQRLKNTLPDGDERNKLLDYLKFLLSNNLEIKDTLGEIHNINSRLRDIANDFLEYSKVSKEVPTEKIEVKGILQKKIDAYTGECAEQQIIIISHLDSSKKVVMFEHQILKIFGNLFDNAIKAILEKEAAGDGLREIRVNLSEEYDEPSKNQMLRLEIIDSGIGISSDGLQKIFKPFYTNRKNLQGTGLGLAIVKKIIDEAGGGIQVTSIEGKGTTFTVYLPCYD